MIWLAAAKTMMLMNMDGSHDNDGHHMIWLVHRGLMLCAGLAVGRYARATGFLGGNHRRHITQR